MRITRLQDGYVIRLSDSDFELLAALAEDGEARTIHESDSDRPLSDAGYSAAVQSAYTRRTKCGLFFRVDADRRKRRFKFSPDLTTASTQA